VNSTRPGAVWKDIVDKTGGVHGDICACGDAAACEQTFQRVFTDLATRIVQSSQPIDCEWDIPDPPPGETLDPKKVNVDFIDQVAGTKETIYHVNDATQCDATLGGWYYDDNAAPTRVIACPQSCTKIKAAAQAKLEVVFGCATVDIPPPA
jgi:hypothetical protein